MTCAFFKKQMRQKKTRSHHLAGFFSIPIRSSNLTIGYIPTPYVNVISVLNQPLSFQSFQLGFVEMTVNLSRKHVLRIPTWINLQGRKVTSWRKTAQLIYTIQGINISHQTGKGKSSTQKCPFWGDMLVLGSVAGVSFCWRVFFFHHILLGRSLKKTTSQRLWNDQPSHPKKTGSRFFKHDFPRMRCLYSMSHFNCSQISGSVSCHFQTTTSWWWLLIKSLF